MTEQGKKYVDLMLEEPYKIGHLLGFTDLQELHNEWIKDFVLGVEDLTMQGHRGSYKTTCISIALAIILTIKPNKTNLFMRKTESDVWEIIKQVRKILLSPLWQHIVKEIYGFDIVLTVDNKGEISTNLTTSTKGTSQLLGLGTGASLTGKHFDNIFTDDIVNLKDRISKAEREHTKAIFMELQNVINRNGRFVNTGTPWHKDDCFTLMHNIKRYDCYSTGLITREKLEQIRKSMTPSLFSANYELKHIADEDQLFNNPQFLLRDKDEEKDKQRVALLYDGIVHIDAGYNGEDGTALTIIKKLADGRFIVFGKRWEKHVDDCLNEIEQYMKIYRSGRIYVENNGDKGYLAKDLKKRGHFVKEYHETTNKFIKISTYLRKYWGDIWFLEETDAEYINEILDYNENAEHDDAPDSLASSIRELAEQKKWLY